MSCTCNRARIPISACSQNIRELSTLSTCDIYINTCPRKIPRNSERIVFAKSKFLRTKLYIWTSQGPPGELDESTLSSQMDILQYPYSAHFSAPHLSPNFSVYVCRYVRLRCNALCWQNDGVMLRSHPQITFPIPI